MRGILVTVAILGLASWFTHWFGAQIDRAEREMEEEREERIREWEDRRWS